MSVVLVATRLYVSHSLSFPLIALIKGQKMSTTLRITYSHFHSSAESSRFISICLQIIAVRFALIPCDASSDCAIRSVFYFHFVTIPWMALTVFVAIFLIALLGRLYKKA